jgi:hypothetical protein
MPILKSVSILIVLFLCVETYGQKNIVGNYYNFGGENLELNSDSTFKAIWHYGLLSEWTKGIWSTKNDTIYLQSIPIYDTLERGNIKYNPNIDSIILSPDEKSEKITQKDFREYSHYTYSQSKEKFPTKVFYKNGRFHPIDKNGNLIKKRITAFEGNKKYPIFYKRRKKK